MGLIVVKRHRVGHAAAGEGQPRLPLQERDRLCRAEPLGVLAAVKKAGLVDTLNSAQNITVFAPDNAAFAKIPKATLTKVLSDKAMLTKILTYHVVPGRLTAADLTSQIQAGGGKAELTTVQGGKLTASAGPNGTVILTDAKGGTSTVTQADVMQSNGVVHVVNTVVMPG